MKRALHFFSLSFISLLLFTNHRAAAQCTVSEIYVQHVVVISSTPTSCTIKFDVTFNIADNNGNKFIFIHAWLQNDYPDYFHCVDGHPRNNGSIPAPTASDLGHTLINIGLDNLGPRPVPLTVYPPDPSVPLATMDSTTKVVLPDGSANITLYGVVVTSPMACSGQAVIVADLWSSQSASAQRAHCVNCGIRSSAGYLNAVGIVNCLTLRYTGTITNLTALTINGYYRVFADVNGDGYFTPVTDTLLQTNVNFTVGPFGVLTISGPIPAANIGQDVFIVITQSSGSAITASHVFIFHSTQCGALPVVFSSFSASRISNNNVLVKWVTVTELNNAGFTVQRNTGTGWTSQGFVPSLALNGNSNSVLNYSFNDNNSSKSITQYRIMQTDIDNHDRYSEVRVVRGTLQQQKILIYPNPGPAGSVNVLMEDRTGLNDITLTDVSGHTIRQWSGLASNNLRIDNLRAGIYFLKVISRETGGLSMEKIIIY